MISSEHSSDAELWAGARDGNADAFVAIYRRHATSVLTQCIRHLGDRHTAEDAASIVFFETWRRREQVRLVDDSVLPWMLVTALNVCRNRRRAARRYADHLALLPHDAPVIEDIAEDVIVASDRSQLRQRLAQALGSLRRSERDVVLLCLASELTYEQAAEALQVPIGTVRSRLSRGRAKLRAALEDNNGELATSNARIPVGGPQ